MYWSIANQQCCDSFRCSSKGLGHTYICIHLPLNSPPIQAATLQRAAFPVLYGRSLLVILFFFLVWMLYFILLFFLIIIIFICSGFCHTLIWNSHGFTCVPHPDPPSHLPLKRTASKHVYYLGWNRSPAQVGRTRQALGPGALGRPRGSGWLSTLNITVCTCQFQVPISFPHTPSLATLSSFSKCLTWLLKVLCQNPSWSSKLFRCELLLSRPCMTPHSAPDSDA